MDLMPKMRDLAEVKIPASLQDLAQKQQSIPQIVSYCSASYPASQGPVFEQTQEYTKDALATVAQLVTSVASDITELVKMQAFQLDRMTAQVNAYTERVKTAQLAAGHRGLRSVTAVCTNDSQKPATTAIPAEQLTGVNKPLPTYRYEKFDINSISADRVATSCHRFPTQINAGPATPASPGLFSTPFSTPPSHTPSRPPSSLFTGFTSSLSSANTPSAQTVDYYGNGGGEGGSGRQSMDQLPPPLISAPGAGGYPSQGYSSGIAPPPPPSMAAPPPPSHLAAVPPPPPIVSTGPPPTAPTPPPRSSPLQLSSELRTPAMSVDANNLCLHCGPDQYCTVLGAQILRPQTGTHFFEIEVCNTQSSMIFVGFWAAEDVAMLANYSNSDSRMICLSTGETFHVTTQQPLLQYCFRPGDRLGLLYDSNVGTVHAYVDGQYAEKAFENVSGNMLPAITFYYANDSVRVTPNSFVSA